MRTTELLTTARLAENLHMRPDSVVRKIKNGEIAAVKIGHRWLVRPEILEALLEPSSPQGT
jgi:excisionase family DNA binding protein